MLPHPKTHGTMIFYNPNWRTLPEYQTSNLELTKIWTQHITMHPPQDCEATEAYLPHKSRHEEQHTEATDAKIARNSTLCHTNMEMIKNI